MLKLLFVHYMIMGSLSRMLKYCTNEKIRLVCSLPFTSTES